MLLMASYSVPTMFKYSPSQVPIFEGEHYDYWRNEMKNFFQIRRRMGCRSKRCVNQTSGKQINISQNFQCKDYKRSMGCAEI